MEELIKDLNVVINNTNYKELKRKQAETTKLHDEQAAANTEKQKEEKGNVDPFIEDKLLSELTTAERNLVLNDASQDRQPPLRIVDQPTWSL